MANTDFVYIVNFTESYDLNTYKVIKPFKTLEGASQFLCTMIGNFVNAYGYWDMGDMSGPPQTNDTVSPDALARALHSQSRNGWTPRNPAQIYLVESEHMGKCVLKITIAEVSIGK